MARTKQTARRSTGGHAPKGVLGTSASDGVPKHVQKPAESPAHTEDLNARPARPARARRARSSTDTAVQQVQVAVKAARKKRAAPAKYVKKERSLSPAPYNDGRDKFCYICHNGGSCIVCTDCARVVCATHMVHRPIPAHEMAKLDYVCPSCHIIHVRRQRKKEKKADRHQAAETTDAKYMAFYRKEGGNRVPYLERAVELTVPYHIGYHARANTSEPVGLVLLRLRTLRGDGSIPRVLHEALKQYFVDEELGNLIYREVEFDLNDDKDVVVHKTKIMEALSTFSSFKNGRVLLFIYTHADEETGTLFFGANLAAQTVCNWFDVLIPEEARTILRGHNTTVFMLCCGALLASDAAYEALKAHCLSLRITRLLAFEAGAFQAAFAMPFFLIYAYKFLIENANFDDHQLAGVLTQSLYLGRHSKVVVMTSSDSWQTVSVAEYYWSSRGSRPWGEVLPIQCNGCYALRTYDVTEDKDGNYIASCTEKGCSNVKVYRQRDGDIVLKGIESFWLKRSRK